MSEAARTVSYEEYLRIADSEEGFVEYQDGLVVVMSATTVAHTRIVSQLIELVRGRLRGGACTALTTGLKIRVEATNRTLVPDVTIVCGPLERSTKDAQAIVNPTILFEVLSPTTEDYDQGPKFHHYRRLTSLREYVVVAQDRRWVRIARRAGDLWAFDDVEPLRDVRLESLEVTLTFDEIYGDALGVIV
jgi:Uma2 family endonuclease